MNLLEHIVARAKSDKQRIVLPEATEERTLRAADRVLADDLANLILIGNPEEIKSLAEKWDLHNIDKATIVDPENNPKAEEYVPMPHTTVSRSCTRHTPHASATCPQCA